MVAAVLKHALRGLIVVNWLCVLTNLTFVLLIHSAWSLASAAMGIAGGLAAIRCGWWI
jgi:hypothetical protein